MELVGASVELYSHNNLSRAQGGHFFASKFLCHVQSFLFPSQPTPQAFPLSHKSYRCKPADVVRQVATEILDEL